MTLVDFARHGQGDCSRQNSPIACRPPQDGPFAFPGPSCRQRFQEREAEFIEEHDDGAEPQRLFLSLANLLSAQPSPVLRLARRHAVMAFEHCSPIDPALAGESSDDSQCQIPS